PGICSRLSSVVVDTKSRHCDGCWIVFRCGPLRLQPPRETHSAGSSSTCYSHRTRKAPEAFTSHEENWFVFSRSQGSSAPNNHHSGDSDQSDTPLILIQGRSTKIDIYKQYRHTICQVNEAHGSPAERVVYFRIGISCRSLIQLRGLKATTLFVEAEYPQMSLVGRACTRSPSPKT